MHTSERPYNCGLCERAFSTKSKLHEHIKIHRLDEQQGILAKYYPCAVCSKGFSSLRLLDKHMRYLFNEYIHLIINKYITLLLMILATTSKFVKSHINAKYAKKCSNAASHLLTTNINKLMRTLNFCNNYYRHLKSVQMLITL